MKKWCALLKLRHYLDWDEETKMKKTTMMLTSFVFAMALGLSGPAGAGTMGDCKTVAGKARYDVETDCYNSYGPTSGKWSATDRARWMRVWAAWNSSTPPIFWAAGRCIWRPMRVLFLRIVRERLPLDLVSRSESGFSWLSRPLVSPGSG